MGCIYMHINKVNFKKYVGQTVRDWKYASRRFGKNGNGYKGIQFWNAIEKYGWDGFYHICLLDNVKGEELDYYERMYIKIYNTHGRGGYNANDGGIIVDRDSKRENMSKSRLGKHYSESHKRHISESLLGKKLSKEHKKKLSESHKGKASKGDRRKAIICIDLNNRFVSSNKEISVLAQELKLNEDDIRSFLSVDNKEDNIKGYRFLYKNYYNKMIMEGLSFEDVKKSYDDVMSNCIKGIKRSDETKKKMAEAKISRAAFVVAKRLSDGKEYVFHSGREIERILGINNTVIYKILRGKTRSDEYKGYSYRFATDDEKKLYDPDLLERCVREDFKDKFED